MISADIYYTLDDYHFTQSERELIRRRMGEVAQRYSPDVVFLDDTAESSLGTVTLRLEQSWAPSFDFFSYNVKSLQLLLEHACPGSLAYGLAGSFCGTSIDGELGQASGSRPYRIINYVVDTTPRQRVVPQG